MNRFHRAMTCRRSTFLSALFAASFGAGLVVGAQGGAPAVESLVTPAGPASSVPQVTVEGERIVLSWVERDGKRSTLKFAERTASGWSTPAAVVSSDRLMVNAADVPSVRLMPDGSFAAHWLEESGPDPEAYNLRIAWSADGKTWSPGVAPNRDSTISQHGFASLFPAVSGGLGVIWLDGRTTHGDEGDMQLRAAVFDKNHQSLSDTLIDARVCECCPTSVAITAEGPIAAYRDRSANDIRDIYVTRLSAGRWSKPINVHRDGYKITGCPINGPAVAARGNNVVVAWFTAAKEMNCSYVAFSDDGGRTFGPPARVDDVSSMGRMAVALADDGFAVVGWVEFANQKSQFKVRRIEHNGTKDAAMTVADVSGQRFPRLALANGEVVLAWTETEHESLRVKTARIRLAK